MQDQIQLNNYNHEFIDHEIDNHHNTQTDENNNRINIMNNNSMDSYSTSQRIRVRIRRTNKRNGDKNSILLNINSTTSAQLRCFRCLNDKSLKIYQVSQQVITVESRFYEASGRIFSYS